MASNSGQRRASSGQSISIGGITASGAMVLSASMSGSAGPLAIEVEALPVGQMDFSSASRGASAFTTDGTASVTLSLSAGAYHWRCRVVDPSGDYGNWTSFGGNPESASDFIVMPEGSAGPYCRDAASLNPPTGTRANPGGSK